MDRVLGLKYILPGIRFHPTDEELFMYYLKRKLMGKSFRQQMIADVHVYRFAPCDLPSMSYLKTRDLTWYFFCPRLNKYAHGCRANRANEFGYWKSTGNDRTVQYKKRPVGKIKTLVFHQGKAPNGVRTDWVIHEYRMEDKALADHGVSQDAYVICKIYQKSGLGPKNGEQYGAPFVEEEWDTDDDNMVTNQVHHSNNNGSTDNQNNSPVPSAGTSDAAAAADAWAPSTSGQHFTIKETHCDSTALIPTIEQQPILAETEPLATSGTDDELERMLAMFCAHDAPAPTVEVEQPLDRGFFDGLENSVPPVEAELPLDRGFFDGLENLGEMCRSSGVGSNWSQMLAGVDSAGEFIELNDLSN